MKIDLITWQEWAYDILRKLDFENVIKDFAKIKSRKVVGIQF